MEAFLSGLDLLMNWQVLGALLIGSVGGVVIGAIPGVGAAVAIAILLPATFSLPPLVGLTMLLGIYGSSMYGGALPAILINTPGPQLFQNDMPFVMALYTAMLVLNVIVLIFLMFSTNWLTRIIRIPTRLLGVGILVLGFVGVYSLRNSATDCAMAAGFGVFGLMLKRLNLPIVPIVLGMVLGGIMETRLRSAMPRLKTPLDMVDRPIAAILAGLIVLVIALHLRTLLREHRTPPDTGG